MYHFIHSLFGYMIYYFAYCTNMDIQQLNNMEIHPLGEPEPGFIIGCKLTFNKRSSIKGRGFATFDVTDNPEDVVEGVLYKLTMMQFRHLELYDGFPYHYDMASVKVYLKNSLKRVPEYVKLMLNARSFLSEDYISRLERYLLNSKDDT